MQNESRRLLSGNEAIALGLISQGCRVITAYPGTPSSEILPAAVEFARGSGWHLYAEWSANEKVALEVALAASWAGQRAAAVMKQVGLNVAADPFFSSAYTGGVGGLVVVVADDPGPYASQTEQDSRWLALAAKVPALDPGTVAEAHAMAEYALDLSERYGLPVVLRPTTRVCHGREDILFSDPESNSNGRRATFAFHKEPKRWAATPRARLTLHHELNAKLARLEEELISSPFNRRLGAPGPGTLGIIGSGIAFCATREILDEFGIELPLLKIGTSHPLPWALIEEFFAQVKTILVVEEPDAYIERLVAARGWVRGRLDGTLPQAGELGPEVLYGALRRVLLEAGLPAPPTANPAISPQWVQELDLPIRKPRLCPGCAHRSAFFAIKREFGPRAIYPSDIGCYTLGLNLRAVDTCLNMGASLGIAAGLDQAHRLAAETGPEEKKNSPADRRPIIASIGDSTFLHAGLPGLINAVHTGARFVLVILDNGTTAMTGAQPTPAGAYLADSSEAPARVSIPDLVRACGVEFIARIDPYDQETFRQALRWAYQHTQDPAGGIAVVIAERACILASRAQKVKSTKTAHRPVQISPECDGCGYCVAAFECPALEIVSIDAGERRIQTRTGEKHPGQKESGARARINPRLCIDCGQCVFACPRGLIVPLDQPISEHRPDQETRWRSR